MTPTEELIARAEKEVEAVERLQRAGVMINQAGVDTADLRALIQLAKDDPEMDATDFAHPAWWRGNDQGVIVLCGMINKILDGNDAGRGTSREPWESTRRRLIQLARSSPIREGWPTEGVELPDDMRVPLPEVRRYILASPELLALIEAAREYGRRSCGLHCGASSLGRIQR